MKRKRNPVKKIYRFVRRSWHKKYREFVSRIETELGAALDETC